MDIPEVFRSLGNFVMVPLVGALAFFGKSQLSRIDEHEKRLMESEKDIAVIESQLEDTAKDIEEIKLGINRLIDKLL